MKSPREDTFVSICVQFGASSQDIISEILSLAAVMSERFRYWEILVGISADRVDGPQSLLNQIPHLRLLKLRPGADFYRSRVALASEAIGDVVVLTTSSEIKSFNLIEFIDLAHFKQSVIVGRGYKYGFLNPALAALGRSAGFHADGRDMLTTCFPRTILNQVLAHSNREVGLRYPPIDDSIPVAWQSPIGSVPPRSLSELTRRITLLNSLVTSSAPNILYFVSLLSVTVVAAAVGFALYAIAVIFTLEDVQPGWFTTSIFLSITAGFLGAAIFAICIGLQRIIETLAPNISDDIVGEQSAPDMFAHASRQLNVEFDDIASAPESKVKFDDN